MEKTDILCTGALGPKGERKPVFECVLMTARKFQKQQRERVSCIRVWVEACQQGECLGNECCEDASKEELKTLMHTHVATHEPVYAITELQITRYLMMCTAHKLHRLNVFQILFHVQINFACFRFKSVIQEWINSLKSGHPDMNIIALEN